LKDIGKRFQSAPLQAFFGDFLMQFLSFKSFKNLGAVVLFNYIFYFFLWWCSAHDFVLIAVYIRKCRPSICRAISSSSSRLFETVISYRILLYSVIGRSDSDVTLILKVTPINYTLWHVRICPAHHWSLHDITSPRVTHCTLTLHSIAGGLSAAVEAAPCILSS